MEDIQKGENSMVVNKDKALDVMKNVLVDEAQALRDAVDKLIPEL